MKRGHSSLISRLSRRLILLQVLALTLVVVIVAIPEPDRRGIYELDEAVLAKIAENLQADGARLYLSPGSAFLAEMSATPGFWFMVGDSAGRRVEYGPIPQGVHALFSDVGAVVDVEAYWEPGRPDSGMIGARQSSAVGPVSILTGGGPTLSPVIGRLKDINPYYLTVLAVVTTVVALGIPWLLRRDLEGVSRVAEEAARIDINQPGTRLTESNVPPELQAMVGAMNAALSRFDEGLERRKRFLATAAHELRTPVAILMLRIEQLPEGPEKRRLTLDVARLSALANQLLDLERLDDDTSVHHWLDLADLVREAVTEIAPLAIATRADLSLDVPQQPVGILGDRQAIQRVVINLVQNAIAHGGDGVSIEVDVRAPATVVVSDSGPGIAVADRVQIFEPFFRRSEARGSGLGLHLVQQIVNRHGGSIAVGDSADGGAEFVLRFPLADRDAAAQQMV
ncbi:HAMP domain-containing histidine kinase [Fertoebacter nigrum]|uniref:histidine kinase n=1 Tax=Fertoeibacter niger TaxID=2656921 RepID=A0A8X8H2H6_9RHOB|nr:HAMP domain-containing sensor histidine kinase [Fertoeibacter niger]NUB45002.1 HAMP domain-containing histidine kinase [Fertoeibacter niger]